MKFTVPKSCHYYKHQGPPPLAI